MLQRSTQIGEFYRMKPPEVWNVNEGKLPPHYMDILIFDEESDRHVRITFEAALKAANAKAGFFAAYNNDGADWTGDKDKIQEGGRHQLPRTPLSPRRWRDPTGEDNADNVDGSSRCGSPGRWVPVELVIARPFIEHLMMSAVLAVAGRDTGATLCGPAGARRTRALWPLYATPSALSIRSSLALADMQICGEHVGQDDRGPRAFAIPLPRAPNGTAKGRHTNGAPLQTVHAHKIRHHEAPKRLRDARPALLGLRRGRQHRLLRRGRGERRQHRPRHGAAR